MQTLADRQLVPGRKNLQTLPADEITALQQQLLDWEIRSEGGVTRLYRTFSFPNYAEALQFTIDTGALAEAANHHPALLTEWGSVTVSWWTHTLRGLHLNDFIMAARCDALFADRRRKS